MQVLSLFQLESFPRLTPGDLRLTRLNIYSALYLEYQRARILIDPSKVPPQAAMALDPDLILVSHESMDHFDAPLCLKLLEREDSYLIGSWGVVISLTDYLSDDDPRWQRIGVGIPGASFTFGQVVINIEESRHCEYAVPIFFDIRDANTGFRILDAIDSELTPRMQNGEISLQPDILVVPLGIALAASASEGWKMVQLLQPSLIFANHYTIQRPEFISLVGDRYQEDKRIILRWFEGTTLKGADPQYRPDPVISIRANYIFPDLANKFAAWLKERPSESSVLKEWENANEPTSKATILYFLAWNSLLGQSTIETLLMLEKVKDQCLATDAEPLAATFLLAYGASLGSVASESAAGVTALKKLLDPARPYLDYWVFESWGRAARQPSLKEVVIGFFDEVTTDDELFAVVGVRRKVMWEVHRLVEMGYRWPSLKKFLISGHTDSNPDVRLLAYKLLPSCRSVFDDVSTLLADGINDPHEDVLEWAIIAHIGLFDSLAPKERELAAARLPELLTHWNYHVRDRASILAELMAGD